MPIPGLSEGIGAGVSLIGGWLQARAARRAAEEQRRAGTEEANRLTGIANENAGRVDAAGTAAAAGLENAGGAAQAGVAEAGRQGQAAIGSALTRFDPYSEAGRSALQRLQSGIGEGGEFSSTFNFDPSTAGGEAGLRFQQQQAQSALINSGLRSGLLGGNTARALDEQTQAITSQYLGDAFNRQRSQFQMNRENALNPLQALIGVGERANNSILGGTTDSANMGNETAGQVGEIGLRTAQGAGNFRTDATRGAAGINMGAASQAADLRTGGAAAGAAGTVGAGNAWAEALSNLSRSVDFEGIGRRRPRRATALAPTVSPGMYATGGGSGG